MGDNVTVNVREIGWKGVDWMRLAQNMDQWYIPRFLLRKTSSACVCVFSVHWLNYRL